MPRPGTLFRRKGQSVESHSLHLSEIDTMRTKRPRIYCDRCHQVKPPLNGWLFKSQRFLSIHTECGHMLPNHFESKLDKVSFHQLAMQTKAAGIEWKINHDYPSQTETIRPGQVDEIASDPVFCKNIESCLGESINDVDTKTHDRKREEVDETVKEQGEESAQMMNSEKRPPPVMAKPKIIHQKYFGGVQSEECQAQPTNGYTFDYLSSCGQNFDDTPERRKPGQEDLASGCHFTLDSAQWRQGHVDRLQKVFETRPDYFTSARFPHKSEHTSGKQQILHEESTRKNTEVTCDYPEYPCGLEKTDDVIACKKAKSGKQQSNAVKESDTVLMKEGQDVKLNNESQVNQGDGDVYRPVSVQEMARKLENFFQTRPLPLKPSTKTMMFEEKTTTSNNSGASVSRLRERSTIEHFKPFPFLDGVIQRSRDRVVSIHSFFNGDQNRTCKGERTPNSCLKNEINNYVDRSQETVPDSDKPHTDTACDVAKTPESKIRQKSSLTPLQMSVIAELKTKITHRLDNNTRVAKSASSCNTLKSNGHSNTYAGREETTSLFSRLCKKYREKAVCLSKDIHPVKYVGLFESDYHQRCHLREIPHKRNTLVKFNRHYIDREMRVHMELKHRNDYTKCSKRSKDKTPKSIMKYQNIHAKHNTRNAAENNRGKNLSPRGLNVVQQETVHPVLNGEMRTPRSECKRNNQQLCEMRTPRNECKRNNQQLCAISYVGRRYACANKTNSRRCTHIHSSDVSEKNCSSNLVFSKSLAAVIQKSNTIGSDWCVDSGIFKRHVGGNSVMSKITHETPTKLSVVDVGSPRSNKRASDSFPSLKISASLLLLPPQLEKWIPSFGSSCENAERHVCSSPDTIPSINQSSLALIVSNNALSGEDTKGYTDDTVQIIQCIESEQLQVTGVDVSLEDEGTDKSECDIPWSSGVETLFSAHNTNKSHTSSGTDSFVACTLHEGMGDDKDSVANEGELTNRTQSSSQRQSKRLIKKEFSSPDISAWTSFPHNAGNEGISKTGNSQYAVHKSYEVNTTKRRGSKATLHKHFDHEKYSKHKPVSDSVISDKTGHSNEALSRQSSYVSAESKFSISAQKISSTDTDIIHSACMTNTPGESFTSCLPASDYSSVISVTNSATPAFQTESLSDIFHSVSSDASTTMLDTSKENGTSVTDQSKTEAQTCGSKRKRDSDPAMQKKLSLSEPACCAREQMHNSQSTERNMWHDSNIFNDIHKVESNCQTNLQKDVKKDIVTKKIISHESHVSDVINDLKEISETLTWQANRTYCVASQEIQPKQTKNPFTEKIWQKRLNVKSNVEQWLSLLPFPDQLKNVSKVHEKPSSSSVDLTTCLSKAGSTCSASTATSVNDKRNVSDKENSTSFLVNAPTDATDVRCHGKSEGKRAQSGFFRESSKKDENITILRPPAQPTYPKSPVKQAQTSSESLKKDENTTILRPPAQPTYPKSPVKQAQTSSESPKKDENATNLRTPSPPTFSKSHIKQAQTSRGRVNMNAANSRYMRNNAYSPMSDYKSCISLDTISAFQDSLSSCQSDSFRSATSREGLYVVDNFLPLPKLERKANGPCTACLQEKGFGIKDIRRPKKEQLKGNGKRRAFRKLRSKKRNLVRFGDHKRAQMHQPNLTTPETSAKSLAHTLFQRYNAIGHFFQDVFEHQTVATPDLFAITSSESVFLDPLRSSPESGEGTESELNLISSSNKLLDSTTWHEFKQTVKPKKRSKKYHVPKRTKRVKHDKAVEVNIEPNGDYAAQSCVPEKTKAVKYNSEQLSDTFPHACRFILNPETCDRTASTEPRDSENLELTIHSFEKNSPAEDQKFGETVKIVAGGETFNITAESKCVGPGDFDETLTIQAFTGDQVDEELKQGLDIQETKDKESILLADEPLTLSVVTVSQKGLHVSDVPLPVTTTVGRKVQGYPTLSQDESVRLDMPPYQSVLPPYQFSVSSDVELSFHISGSINEASITISPSDGDQYLADTRGPVSDQQRDCIYSLRTPFNSHGANEDLQNHFAAKIHVRHKPDVNLATINYVPKQSESMQIHDATNEHEPYINQSTSNFVTKPFSAEQSHSTANKHVKKRNQSTSNFVTKPFSAEQSHSTANKHVKKRNQTTMNIVPKQSEVMMFPGSGVVTNPLCVLPEARSAFSGNREDCYNMGSKGIQYSESDEEVAHIMCEALYNSPVKTNPLETKSPSKVLSFSCDESHSTVTIKGPSTPYPSEPAYSEEDAIDTEDLFIESDEDQTSIPYHVSLETFHNLEDSQYSSSEETCNVVEVTFDDVPVPGAVLENEESATHLAEKIEATLSPIFEEFSPFWNEMDDFNCHSRTYSRENVSLSGQSKLLQKYIKRTITKPRENDRRDEVTLYHENKSDDSNSNNDDQLFALIQLLNSISHCLEKTADMYKREEDLSCEKNHVKNLESKANHSKGTDNSQTDLNYCVTFSNNAKLNNCGVTSPNPEMDVENIAPQIGKDLRILLAQALQIVRRLKFQIGTGSTRSASLDSWKKRSEIDILHGLLSQMKTEIENEDEFMGKVNDEECDTMSVSEIGTTPNSENENVSSEAFSQNDTYVVSELSQKSVFDKVDIQSSETSSPKRKPITTEKILSHTRKGKTSDESIIKNDNIGKIEIMCRYLQTSTCHLKQCGYDQMFASVFGKSTSSASVCEYGISCHDNADDKHQRVACVAGVTKDNDAMLNQSETSVYEGIESAKSITNEYAERNSTPKNCISQIGPVRDNLSKPNSFRNHVQSFVTTHPDSSPSGISVYTISEHPDFTHFSNISSAFGKKTHSDNDFQKSKTYAPSESSVTKQTPVSVTTDVAEMIQRRSKVALHKQARDTPLTLLRAASQEFHSCSDDSTNACRKHDSTVLLTKPVLYTLGPSAKVHMQQYTLPSMVSSSNENNILYDEHGTRVHRGTANGQFPVSSIITSTQEACGNGICAASTPQAYQSIPNTLNAVNVQLPAGLMDGKEHINTKSKCAKSYSLHKIGNKCFWIEYPLEENKFLSPNNRHDVNSYSDITFMRDNVFSSSEEKTAFKVYTDCKNNGDSNVPHCPDMMENPKECLSQNMKARQVFQNQETNKKRNNSRLRNQDVVSPLDEAHAVFVSMCVVSETVDPITEQHLFSVTDTAANNNKNHVLSQHSPMYHRRRFHDCTGVRSITSDRTSHEETNMSDLTDGSPNNVRLSDSFQSIQSDSEVEGSQGMKLPSIPLSYFYHPQENKEHPRCYHHVSTNQNAANSPPQSSDDDQEPDNQQVFIKFTCAPNQEEGNLETNAQSPHSIAACTSQNLHKASDAQSPHSIAACTSQNLHKASDAQSPHSIAACTSQNLHKASESPMPLSLCSSREKLCVSEKIGFFTRQINEVTKTKTAKGMSVIDTRKATPVKCMLSKYQSEIGQGLHPHKKDTCNFKDTHRDSAEISCRKYSCQAVNTTKEGSITSEKFEKDKTRTCHSKLSETLITQGEKKEYPVEDLYDNSDSELFSDASDSSEKSIKPLTVASKRSVKDGFRSKSADISELISCSTENFHKRKSDTQISKQHSRLPMFNSKTHMPCVAHKDSNVATKKLTKQYVRKTRNMTMAKSAGSGLPVRLSDSNIITCKTRKPKPDNNGTSDEAQKLVIESPLENQMSGHDPKPDNGTSDEAQKSIIETTLENQMSCHDNRCEEMPPGTETKLVSEKLCRPTHDHSKSAVGNPSRFNETEPETLPGSHIPHYKKSKRLIPCVNRTRLIPFVNSSQTSSREPVYLKKVNLKVTSPTLKTRDNIKCKWNEHPDRSRATLAKRAFDSISYASGQGMEQGKTMTEVTRAKSNKFQSRFCVSQKEPEATASGSFEVIENSCCDGFSQTLGSNQDEYISSISECFIIGDFNTEHKQSTPIESSQSSEKSSASSDSYTTAALGGHKTAPSYAHNENNQQGTRNAGRNCRQYFGEKPQFQRFYSPEQADSMRNAAISVNVGSVSIYERSPDCVCSQEVFEYAMNKRSPNSIKQCPCHWRKCECCTLSNKYGNDGGFCKCSQNVQHQHSTNRAKRPVTHYCKCSTRGTSNEIELSKSMIATSKPPLLNLPKYIEKLARLLKEPISNLNIFSRNASTSDQQSHPTQNLEKDKKDLLFKHSGGGYMQGKSYLREAVKTYNEQKQVCHPTAEKQNHSVAEEVNRSKFCSPTVANNIRTYNDPAFVLHVPGNYSIRNSTETLRGRNRYHEGRQQNQIKTESVRDFSDTPELVSKTRSTRKTSTEMEQVKRKLHRNTLVQRNQKHVPPNSSKNTTTEMKSRDPVVSNNGFYVRKRRIRAAEANLTKNANDDDTYQQMQSCTEQYDTIFEDVVESFPSFVYRSERASSNVNENKMDKESESERNCHDKTQDQITDTTPTKTLSSRVTSVQRRSITSQPLGSLTQKGIYLSPKHHRYASFSSRVSASSSSSNDTYVTSKSEIDIMVNDLLSNSHPSACKERKTDLKNNSTGNHCGCRKTLINQTVPFSHKCHEQDSVTNLEKVSSQESARKSAQLSSSEDGFISYGYYSPTEFLDTEVQKQESTRPVYHDETILKENTETERKMTEETSSIPNKDEHGKLGTTTNNTQGTQESYPAENHHEIHVQNLTTAHTEHDQEQMKQKLATDLTKFDPRKPPKSTKVMKNICKEGEAEMETVELKGEDNQYDSIQGTSKAQGNDQQKKSGQKGKNMNRNKRRNTKKKKKNDITNSAQHPTMDCGENPSEIGNKGMKRQTDEKATHKSKKSNQKNEDKSEQPPCSCKSYTCKIHHSPIAKIEILKRSSDVEIVTRVRRSPRIDQEHFYSPRDGDHGLDGVQYKTPCERFPNVYERMSIKTDQQEHTPENMAGLGYGRPLTNNDISLNMNSKTFDSSSDDHVCIRTSPVKVSSQESDSHQQIQQVRGVRRKMCIFHDHDPHTVPGKVHKSRRFYSITSTPDENGEMHTIFGLVKMAEGIDSRGKGKRFKENVSAKHFSHRNHSTSTSSECSNVVEIEEKFMTNSVVTVNDEKMYIHKSGRSNSAIPTTTRHLTRNDITRNHRNCTKNLSVHSKITVPDADETTQPSSHSSDEREFSSLKERKSGKRTMCRVCHSKTHPTTLPPTRASGCQVRCDKFESCVSLLSSSGDEMKGSVDSTSNQSLHYAPRESCRAAFSSSSITHLPPKIWFVSELSSDKMNPHVRYSEAHLKRLQRHHAHCSKSLNVSSRNNNRASSKKWDSYGKKSGKPNAVSYRPVKHGHRDSHRSIDESTGKEINNNRKNKSDRRSKDHEINDVKSKTEDKNSNKKTTSFRITAEPSTGKTTLPSFKIEMSPSSEDSSDEPVIKQVKREEIQSPNQSTKVIMTEMKRHKKLFKNALQHTFPPCVYRSSKTNQHSGRVTLKMIESSSYSSDSSSSNDNSVNQMTNSGKNQQRRVTPSADEGVTQFTIETKSPPRTSNKSAPRVYQVNATMKNKEPAPPTKENIHVRSSTAILRIPMNVVSPCSPSTEQHKCKHVFRTFTRENLSSDCAMDLMAEALKNLKRNPQKGGHKTYRKREIPNFRLAQRSSCSVVSAVPSSPSLQCDHHLRTTRSFSLKRNTSIKRLSLSKAVSNRLQKTRRALRTQELLLRLVRKTQAVLQHAMLTTRREIVEEKNRTRQKQLQVAMKIASYKRLLSKSVTASTSSSTEQKHVDDVSLLNSEDTCAQPNLSVISVQITTSENTSSDQQVMQEPRYCRSSFARSEADSFPSRVMQRPVVDELCSSCLLVETRGYSRPNAPSKRNKRPKCSTPVFMLNRGNNCRPRLCLSTPSLTIECPTRRLHVKRLPRYSKSDSSLSCTSFTDSATENKQIPVASKKLVIQRKLETSQNNRNDIFWCQSDNRKRSCAQQSIHPKENNRNQSKKSPLSKRTTDVYNSRLLLIHEDYFNNLQQLARQVASKAMRKASKYQLEMRKTRGSLQHCESQSQIRYFVTLEDLSRMVAAVCMTATDQGITAQWKRFCSVLLPQKQISLTTVHAAHDTSDTDQGDRFYGAVGPIRPSHNVHSTARAVKRVRLPGSCHVHRETSKICAVARGKEVCRIPSDKMFHQPPRSYSDVSVRTEIQTASPMPCQVCCSSKRTLKNDQPFVFNQGNPKIIQSQMTSYASCCDASKFPTCTNVTNHGHAIPQARRLSVSIISPCTDNRSNQHDCSCHISKRTSVPYRYKPTSTPHQRMQTSGQNRRHDCAGFNRSQPDMCLVEHYQESIQEISSSFSSGSLQSMTERRASKIVISTSSKQKLRDLQQRRSKAHHRYRDKQPRVAVGEFCTAQLHHKEANTPQRGSMDTGQFQCATHFSERSVGGDTVYRREPCCSRHSSCTDNVNGHFHINVAHGYQDEPCPKPTYCARRKSSNFRLQSVGEGNGQAMYHALDQHTDGGPSHCNRCRNHSFELRQQNYTRSNSHRDVAVQPVLNYDATYHHGADLSWSHTKRDAHAHLHRHSAFPHNDQTDDFHGHSNRIHKSYFPIDAKTRCATGHRHHCQDRSRNSSPDAARNAHRHSHRVSTSARLSPHFSARYPADRRAVNSEVRRRVDGKLRQLARDHPQEIRRLSYQQLLRANDQVLDWLQVDTGWDADSLNRAFRDAVYRGYLRLHQPDMYFSWKDGLHPLLLS